MLEAKVTFSYFLWEEERRCIWHSKMWQKNVVTLVEITLKTKNKKNKKEKNVKFLRNASEWWIKMFIDEYIYTDF